MPRPKRPKSPTSIEIWRHEVSASLSLSPSIHPSTTIITSSIPPHNTPSSPPHTTPSLFRKLKSLRLSHHTSKQVTTTSSPTTRTEMYSTSTSTDQSPITEADYVVRDDESIDFASEHSDILGGLREKAERLERARRLLDATKREGDGVKGNES